MSDSPRDSLKSDVEKRINTYFQTHEDHLPVSGLYDAVMKEIEKVLISSTLNFVNGNQVKASKILGINRNTLRKKIKELESY
jgi:two-component system nitrogen regulation response regulator GlnG